MAIQFFCLILLGVIQFMPGPSRAGASETGGKDRLSGNAAIAYRIRYDSETSSVFHQFVQRADLTCRPFSDDSPIVFSGDLYENAGGGTDDERPGTVWSTYGDVHGFIHELYAETKNLPGGMDVKAGRQYVTNALPVHLDGLQARCRFSGGKGTAYVLGGYSADPYGDEAWDYSKVAGTGLGYTLTERTRAGADLLLTREDPGEEDKASFTQTAWSITHDFEATRLRLALTTLDSDPDTVSLQTYFSGLAGDDSFALLSYVHRFTETGRMPAASTPFIRILGPVKPYAQITATLSKGLQDTGITVSAGADYRKLLKNEKDSEFNHSYVHGYAALEKEGLLGKDLRVSFQADFWKNADAGADDKTTVTGGGEAEFGKNGKTSLAIGSFYSRYTYDYYMDLGEKTDVYTLFSRIRHRIGGSLQIKGEYRMDIDDRQEHRLDVKAELDF